MRTLLVVVLAAASLVAPVSAASPTAEEETSPLPAYLANGDDTYDWVKHDEGRVGAASYVELTLTSQTWREAPWRHQLFIIRPGIVDQEKTHALLFIAGGRWVEPDGDGGEDLPSDALLFAGLASWLRTPIAVLRQVPYQPLFDGKTEDALIAFTFDQYLATLDPEWPLLLPMVKSVVRAMDAVQEFSAVEWGLGIGEFTVAGASKRGWTTWLTGALDDRVAAIAPMVFDMLNMTEQLEHQEAVWGELSEQLADYAALGLPGRLDTEAGRQLQAIVDPYHYRELLTRPKLIILGTNDPYWPMDALNLYWDDLQGPKYILYVPNGTHSPDSLFRYVRLAGSLRALHEHVGAGQRLPEPQWRFDERAGRLALTVTSDLEPSRVTAWTATSDTRDFRDARWRAHRFERAGDAYEFELEIPSQGFAAVFGELTFRRSGPPFFLSTNIRVVGD
jgi:PhoPQ-activated pathogenicity-related protein